MRLPALTDRLPLGKSGLEVSPFALGMVMDEATIPAAYDAGINFFFITADMHWPMYEGTRRGIAMLLERGGGVRDTIVVAIASYVTQQEFMWMPFDEARMEMSLERIDVSIAGGSYAHDFPRRLDVLSNHKRAGYLGVKGIGTSFHDRVCAREAVAGGALDIAFVRFNPNHPGAREDLFPHVKPRGEARTTLLYNFKSTIGHIAKEDEYAKHGIGADFWRPHITDYYRFALSHNALDGVLCSLPSPASVRELADAMAKGPLDEEDQQYLLDLGALQRGKARLA